MARCEAFTARGFEPFRPWNSGWIAAITRTVLVGTSLIQVYWKCRADTRSVTPRRTPGKMFPDERSETREETTTMADRIDRRSSGVVIFAVLALGILAGYLMGWVSFESPWAVGQAPPPLYDEALVTSLFEDASRAVIEISVSRRVENPALGGRPVVEGAASGFLVDDAGHIVTNFHVVNGADRIDVHLYDGRTLRATTVGTSPADDLALLQVDPDEVAGIEPLPLADSDLVVPGQMAIAIGSPFRNFNSISVGVVSGKGRSRSSVLRRPIPDLIQTDAALNPGNSGGPLLNANGEVIGVNSSVEVVSSVQIGVGFAVPSNTLKGILPDLLVAGEIRRPWIGISGTPLTKSLSDSLGLPTESGIYIRQVWGGSPAHRGDLRSDSRRVPTGEGDVITAVDDVQVDSVTDMVSYLNTLRPGDQVTLTIVRDKKSLQVDLTLDPWPDT